MADFSISAFRTALKSGSRPNLFRINVSLPSGITDSTNNSVNVGGYTTLVRSAALPSATIGTIELPMGAGRRLKLGGDRVFSEWTSTVLNDENYLLRSSLEAWQNQMVYTNFAITDSVGNRSADVSTDASLYGAVEIFQLNESGISVPYGSYRLVNCWPSDISAIDLSYDTTDAIEDFTVTWTYDYYENNFTSTTGSAEKDITGIVATESSDG